MRVLVRRNKDPRWSAERTTLGGVAPETHSRIGDIGIGRHATLGDYPEAAELWPAATAGCVLFQTF
jgi:hypothetical protein